MSDSAANDGVFDYSHIHQARRQAKKGKKLSGAGGVTWRHPKGQRGRSFNCPFSKNTNVHGGHGGGGGQGRPRQTGADGRITPNPDQPEECDQQESDLLHEPPQEPVG